MQQFKDLAIGQLFINEGRIYRKTPDRKAVHRHTVYKYNAINISTQACTRFAAGEQVQPIQPVEVLR